MASETQAQHISSDPHTAALRDETIFVQQLKNRHLRGAIGKLFFQTAIIIGLIALLTLVFNVANRIVGLVAVREQIPASQLSDRPLSELSSEELIRIYDENARGGARVYILDNLVGRDAFDANRTGTMGEFLPNLNLPEAIAAKPLAGEGGIDAADAAQIMLLVLDQPALVSLVETNVVGLETLEAWTFSESVFNRATIENQVATLSELEGSRLEWRNWLTPQFLTARMNVTAQDSGIRTALFGSLLVIALTVLIAFPLGVGTAIYLEEYSTSNSWLERIIETNIRNLAGVPSIIYGLLGLAIFVRALESITQGRTIISAALTMALLILPIIIINAQEALRAVPPSLREASFGLGATRWQTIWRSVLPAALPGILTGTILGMSRAVGETAPLIIIGAATFIATDPSLTSRFSVIPIQIYNWAKEPREGFGEIAAAAIVLLLIVLLIFNATAIILRQRFRKALQG